jgi:hypothetical protein
MLNQRLNPHAETILRAERDGIVRWLCAAFDYVHVSGSRNRL